jgi:hypothetical protein
VKRTVAFWPGNPAAGELRDFVEQISDVSEVRALAEEMSLEGLAQKYASQSLCRQIAKL